MSPKIPSMAVARTAKKGGTTKANPPRIAHNALSIHHTAARIGSNLGDPLPSAGMLTDVRYRKTLWTTTVTIAIRPASEELTASKRTTGTEAGLSAEMALPRAIEMPVTRVIAPTTA